VFLVGEFAGNTDTYWSVYMYKDAGNGKLYCGPAWDYDLAFENDNRTYPVNELSDFIYATKGSVASESVRRMVNRIVKEDEEAGIFLQSIWNDARKKGLDATTMVKYVDETAALLDESQKLNFKRWPILDKKVHQNHTARGTYTAEVNAVKLYIAERLSKMDELVKQ
jgi:predicted GIY-YIG superfamily endonuclease